MRFDPERFSFLRSWINQIGRSNYISCEGVSIGKLRAIASAVQAEALNGCGRAAGRWCTLRWISSGPRLSASQKTRSRLGSSSARRCRTCRGCLGCRRFYDSARRRVGDSLCERHSRHCLPGVDLGPVAGFWDWHVGPLADIGQASSRDAKPNGQLQHEHRPHRGVQFLTRNDETWRWCRGLGNFSRVRSRSI